MSGVIGVSPSMKSGVLGAHPAGFQKSIAIIGDNKAYETHGKNMTGGYTSPSGEGTWDIRDLNTKFFDEDSIVSISANIFTLQPAKYFIEWGAPCYGGSQNISRLYNVTAAHIEAYSAVDYNHAGGTGLSSGWRVLTITTASEFKVEHNCQNENAAQGHGHGAYYNGSTLTIDSFPVGVFLVVRIHKYT